MFILEGNIGTGKSTFLELISKNIPYSTPAEEIIDQWATKPTGHQLLKNFYEDTQRWAFAMELQTLQHRVQDHLYQQNQNPVTIMERSIYSGYYCFAKNGFEQGFLTPMEWRIYNAWFSFITKQKCKAPQGFIYLQADPEVSYQRSVRRNRDAEETLAKKYLEQIHIMHEDFLIHKKEILPELATVPVLILDCNTDFLQDEQTQLHHIQAVKNFIDTYAQ